MVKDDNTLETLPDAGADSDIAAAGGTGTAPAVSPDDAKVLSLDELNALTGKNYPTKEAALKSIKDTFSYVGKKVEPVIDPAKFISKDQYDTDMFYTKNPEYAAPEVRSILDSMAKANGKSVAEMSKDESFSKVFGKVKGYDEVQNTKSVLETNPRLASSKSKFEKAVEAAKGGDKATAEALAVDAVMEAYSEA